MNKTQAANGLPYGKSKIMGIERGRIRSHSLEISLWKKLWTCRKADYVMMMMITEPASLAVQDVTVLKNEVENI
jgi:hypothetical protein